MYPTQDWMILQHCEEEKDVSLIIPETSKPIFSRTMAHKVVSIGPWKVYPAEGNVFEHNVKLGDIVIVEGLECRTFEYKSNVYMMARARDVICVVKKEK